jgi:tRNA modification GTPase
MVRLSGPQAREIAAGLFRHSARRPRAWQSHRLYHGHVHDPATGRTVDEVLLAYMRGPASYTGQDVVEITGHGGRTGVREILRLCLAAGARPAERGEMTLRAFLNGKLDLAQAEAVADAVAARTPTGLSLAVAQLEGGLSQTVRAARSELMELYAQLEAEIDFTEDDVPPLPPHEVLARLESSRSRIRALLDTASAGHLYREGLRVALMGRPNAGKSSLLNALLQQDRAIVTPVAGTTRDVIEESIDLLGFPAVLADTAGITETTDPVERIGVERSRRAVASADVVVLVIDGSAPLAAADRDVVSLIARPAVVAITKSDLPQRLTEGDVSALLPGAPTVRVSSLTGDGLATLRLAVREAGGGLEGSWEGEVVVTSARHRDALERALTSLSDAEEAVHAGSEADSICTDLRAALAALGEITGESITEDLLSTIFSKFCIGK